MPLPWQQSPRTPLPWQRSPRTRHPGNGLLGHSCPGNGLLGHRHPGNGLLGHHHPGNALLGCGCPGDGFLQVSEVVVPECVLCSDSLRGAADEVVTEQVQAGLGEGRYNDREGGRGVRVELLEGRGVGRGGNEWRG